MKEFSSPKKLSHYPVMLDKVLKICNPENGGNFIDCTFGYGGYSNSILSYPKTKVIAFDSNKTQTDIIYHEKIKDMVDKSKNFKAVFRILSQNYAIISALAGPFFDF